jgi:hypothetical protein
MKLAWFLLPFMGLNAWGQVKFEPLVITRSVALHPQIVDINKDGKNDIVVVDNYIDDKGNDGENIKNICWHSGSDNKRHPILDINYRACDMTTADIDGDGYLDLIGRYDTDGDDLNETGSMFWLKNPLGSKDYKEGQSWEKTDIGFSTYAKDILTADFNQDGKIDIVVRASDHQLNIYLQVTPKKWKILHIEAPSHDGTDVADLNNDGIPDIAINGIWFETTKDVEKNGWIKHDFAPEWYSQKTGKKGMWFDNNSKVIISDLDGDGWKDVVITNAENTGYPVCWYRNPGNTTNKWEKHVIGYMNYCHTLQIADMDNDGDQDIVCGELIPYDSPNPEGYHPVVLFLNKGNSLAWERQVISEKACYGGKVADIDQDGDMDIIAPRNWNKGPLYLWKNMTHKELTASAVKISETVSQNIPVLKIDTPAATYLYDKNGGGFISMIDQDGKDWISFKNTESTAPFNNAATKYRGIPNLGIGGEDQDAGHPGFYQCITRVISPNVIETATKSGKWKFRWAFYDRYAKFTMIQKAADAPYWFLYEGTPAGKWDPSGMYWGNNLDGKRNNWPDLLQNTGIYNNWNWVYAGQKDYPKVIFFKQLKQDDFPDLFSYMGNATGDARQCKDGMVCFGFGRNQQTNPVLTEENNEFIIGFFDREIKNANDHLILTNYVKELH